MEKVTAIIPTYNEEDNIGAAIDSVSWADEVFVVDSFSTDRTVDIAREKGATVRQHEYVNSAAQKNWAIPRAGHEWVFLLDADERVTPSLQEEIIGVLKEEPSFSAYWVKRANHFMGRRIRYSGWGNDAVIRLFRRDESHYEEKHVHAEIICSGAVGRLKNKLDHFTYKGLHAYLEKMDRYTTWGAYDRSKRTGKVTLYHLWIKPLFRFFRAYIMKRGFLDGKAGFVIASFSAYSVFLRSLKIWRLKNGEEFERGKSTEED